MKHLLTLSLILFALAARPCAQTTGVPFVNDLQIRLPPTYVPQGSGTTSCTNLGFTPGAPFVAAFDTNAVGSTAAILLFDFVGCNSPGFPFFPAQPATCAGPVAGGTNVWYALSFSPLPVPMAGITSTTGMTRWNVNVPAGPGFVWVQAVLIDPCSSLTFKFSQAIGFSW
ncbi:MAG: hypothetical protein IPM29_25655 [Planctomycetes bacterium]|nr:hypothetical protein [Planctomycetota bacterium]